MGTHLPLPQRGTARNYGPYLLRPNGCMIKMSLGMELGLGPGDFVLDWDPAPLPQKGDRAPPPMFGPCLLWQNGWMDDAATWHGDRPQSRRLCVRWGPSPPAEPPVPQFSAHFYCGQTAGCIKMSLGTDVGLSPGDFLLDGQPVLPHQKGGGAPQFSANVYCGQTAGWILGTKAGLSPGDCVRCGPSPPQFSVHGYCVRTAGWIKMALGMEVGLVLDGDTAPLPKTGGRAAQIFDPSLLWPNGWMHQDPLGTEV